MGTGRACRCCRELTPAGAQVWASRGDQQKDASSSLARSACATAHTTLLQLSQGYADQRRRKHALAGAGTAQPLPVRVSQPPRMAGPGGPGQGHRAAAARNRLRRCAASRPCCTSSTVAARPSRRPRWSRAPRATVLSFFSGSGRSGGICGRGARAGDKGGWLINGLRSQARCSRLIACHEQLLSSGARADTVQQGSSLAARRACNGQARAGPQAVQRSAEQGGQRNSLLQEAAQHSHATQAWSTLQPLSHTACCPAHPLPPRLPTLPPLPARGSSAAA